ncbi:MAG: Iron-sulfur cluster-binding protein [uncultured Cytophagales bacterium]|uniref:Iron-sulfur cluster-binding protein n=1 Tax=uncultured Cytophagales bacterium TaxID=158755 RepID=A0A6J4KJL7_9SPHI|nr:MAG: Iron-sulfur cluster-binding protein [uncultured Cytophagales bacterium]
MAAPEKIGLGLFVAALAVFLWAFGTSSYRLTPEVVRQSIPDTAHYARLEPALRPLLGKQYPSNFAFVGDVKGAINRVNDRLEDQGQWDQVIYNDYTFPLTKNAGSGILIRNPWLWFSLIFGLAVAGGLLYAGSRYGRQPAGIHNNGIFFRSLTARGWLGIGLGVFLIGFYVLLYWFPEYITNWVVLADPLSRALSGNPASQWFLYGVLYTLVILVLGVRMILKYRHSRYQMLRTGSVMFFQTAFAFLIPEILVLLHQPWYDFKNIWPLDYDFFYSYNLDQLVQSGSFGLFMLMWGILLIVVAVPVITYFYGKRWYCSWVCGCGGLAETLGDPYRQLSDKSLKAWKVERWTVHGVLVFAVLMTVITLVNYFSDYQLLGGLTGGVQKTYGFVIGAGFAGVVGTGFYPFMGSRVWCRFGCPLAAYLGLVQRFKSRFRITTNGGQCISCGNCSTYCEMGIDVRWYAQRGQNIVRSSCVGCGICSAVCPRGVLKLENGPGAGRTDAPPILIGSTSVRLND